MKIHPESISTIADTGNRAIGTSFEFEPPATEAVTKLLVQHGEETIHTPDGDPTFLQQDSTRRVTATGPEVDALLDPDGSVTKFCLSVIGNWFGHSNARDSANNAFFEIMHYPAGGEHTLEVHVDNNISTIFPLMVPEVGGELVIASSTEHRTSADIDEHSPLEICHRVGRAVLLARGTELAHYVRPTIEARTVAVLNVGIA